MKDFSEEIKILFNRLKSKTPFSFSKYADGEWFAMTRCHGNPGNFEWSIRPDETEYINSINKLIESFKYRDENYYVGISCPCCQGDKHEHMKIFSGQSEDNLTFANIFVNSNYRFYIDNFIPYFSEFGNIILVANRVTDINKLPFNVEKFYPVDYNAWIDNIDIVETIIEETKDTEDKIFLFSCGPFGNILAHKLWESNKRNQYLDVGSTLDPWTKSNRLEGKYYSNDEDKRITCIWN